VKAIACLRVPSGSFPASKASAISRAIIGPNALRSTSTALLNSVPLLNQGLPVLRRLSAEITTDTFQTSAAGQYTLTYAIDPTVFDRMTDGQTVNETWHVVLDSGFCITAERDETVTISRQNLTQVDALSPSLWSSRA
jgi:hypothetical protein